MRCCGNRFISIEGLEIYDGLKFKPLEDITYDVRDAAVTLIELYTNTVFSLLKSQILEFNGYNPEKLQQAYLKLCSGSYYCPLLTCNIFHSGDINLAFQDGRHNVLALMKIYNAEKIICSIITSNDLSTGDLTETIRKKYGYAKHIKSSI